MIKFLLDSTVSKLNKYVAVQGPASQCSYSLRQQVHNYCDGVGSLVMRLVIIRNTSVELCYVGFAQRR